MAASGSLPVIDLGGTSTGRVPDEAVDRIGRAAAEFGFFQIVGHGVSDELIEDVWQQTHWFFAQPHAAKLHLVRTKENSRGYYDRELTKNVRDQKEVFDFSHPEHPPGNGSAIDGINTWPERTAFRDAMLRYGDACETVARRLLRAFARSLALPDERFDPYFDGAHSSFVRVNHYPTVDVLTADDAAMTTPLGDMALHHHSDAGALTVLLQDRVGGLQVAHDGSWIDVLPIPGALVVNTGDMMQVWSNDRYRAALHRVAPRLTGDRYSIPYFFNPSYDTDYAPLVHSADDPPRYRTINWGAFRKARADGDYADYGTEIQIEHFRV